MRVVIFFVELGGFPKPYILAGHFISSVLALHFFSSGFVGLGFFWGEQDAIQMVVYFQCLVVLLVIRSCYYMSRACLQASK